MEDKNSNVPLQRVRIQVNPCKRSISKEAKFAICTFDTIADRCLEVTARRVKQVEYLVQYMTQRHGGHIIPFLNLFNTFTKDQSSEQALYCKISEYLNDLMKSPHCHLDPKLYEFIFQQEVHFPEVKRYDKVLHDAATISRKYLNTIFTRKQYGEVQAEDQEMLQHYQDFKDFAVAYRAVKDIVMACGNQQDSYEEVMTAFREIRGGLSKGLPPVDFITKKIIIKIKKLEKLMWQADEAYSRWDVLRETVRELQCNLHKGLHQDNPYFQEKYLQLKEWTRSLIIDLKTLTNEGNQIIADLSKHVYQCRHTQSLWFQAQDEVKQAEQQGKKEAIKSLQEQELEVKVENVESEPQEQPHRVSLVRKMSG